MEINKITFWEKVANYSIVVMAIALLAKMFFSKYLENGIPAVMVVGVVAAVLFLIARLIQYRLRNKKEI